MASTTFFLVRHGEAEGNREHRFIGQSDTPLSELGHQQAELVASRLGGYPISRIVSSDLRRARDTMVPLAERLSLEVELEPRFREIANGEWTGLLPTEIAAGWPDLWERYRNGEDVPRPGGEQWVDVARRARAAFDELAATEEGGVIAVGAHAGVSLSLITWAAGLGKEPNFFRGPFGPLANGSISIIRFPGPRVVAVNDVGHLENRMPEEPLPFLGA
ncbi:MAG: histidine phosphatase family protein [Acidimicrobiia bacterium]